MKKNLVLGAIKGYSYEMLSPFVSSFKKVSFNDDVVLLVNGISNETKQTLAKEGVKTSEFSYRGSGALNSWSRFWPFLNPLFLNGYNPFSRFVLKKILSLQIVRFLHYKDFLIANRDKYEYVLLTDVRDVYFQSDFFQKMNDGRVQCYEEYLKIEDEKLFNSDWILKLFGQEILKKIEHNKILCSGTIVGSVENMIKFLDAFEKVLYKCKDVSVCGMDQGIFNYIIRECYLDHVVINKYGSGNVLTVSNSDKSVYNIKDNMVLYEDGSLIPILHQYDRSIEIVNVFNL